MITLEEAHSRIDLAVKRLSPRPVLLSAAAGCFVSEEITAPINVPNFPRSAMDGIALNIADLQSDGPWHLPLQTVIEAGDVTRHRLKTGHAVKIMTGAPVAEGANAVVPIEHVTIDSDHVTVRDKPRPGAFIRPLGNDIVLGQVIFRAGEFLRPADIGVLASLGFTEVPVVPRPQIALVSTGSEIVEPGELLNHGQIYDSNIPTLHSLLTCDQFPVATMARVRTNEFEPLSEKLRECIRSHDLVITTGAVSMGDYDFIPEVVNKLGGKTLFHKVAVKPGKPTLIAECNGCWLVCLPGNPVSTVVGYFLYVRRILALMTGVPYQSQSVQALLADDLIVKGDRLNIVGVRLENGSSGLMAHAAVRQESGRLSSTRGINGLIMIEAGDRTLKAGSKVLVHLTDQGKPFQSSL